MDAVGGVLEAEAARHLQDGALGGGVGGVAGEADEGGHGGDVYDPAAVRAAGAGVGAGVGGGCLGEHLLEGVVAEEPDTADVDGPVAVEVVEGVFVAAGEGAGFLVVLGLGVAHDAWGEHMLGQFCVTVVEGGRNGNGLDKPALLTRMSSLPYFSTVAATVALMVSSCVTSVLQ